MAEKNYYSRSSFAQGLAVVQDENYKYGYINEQEQEVIPCQFDSAQDFLPNGFAIVSKEYLYGTIDRAGKSVLPCQYEQIYFEEGSPYLLFTQNGSQGIMDFQGKIVLPADYSSVSLFYEKTHYLLRKGELSGAFWLATNQLIPAEYDYLVGMVEGIFLVQKAGKFGVIDTQNHVILPMEYDNIDGRFRYFVTKDADKGSVHNKQGTRIFEIACQDIQECNIGEKSVFAVYQGEGKAGVVDEAGKILIPFEYESLNFYAENFIVVGKANRVWVVNLQHEKISPTDYAQLYYYTPDCVCFFPDDYTVFGIMDAKCQVLQEPIFAEHSFFGTAEEGNYDRYMYAKHKDTQLYGVYSFVKRALVLPCEYDSLEYNDTLAIHYAQKAGKSGIVSADFQEVVPCLYSERLVEVQDYSAEKAVFKGFIATDEAGKKGVIDLQNNVLLPFEYTEIYFEAPDTFTGATTEEPQASEAQEASYGYGEEAPQVTIVQDETTGKFGFQNPLDPSPAVCEYDGIEYVYNGYTVYNNGKAGFADNTGKLIIPIEYAYITEKMPNAYYMARLEEESQEKGVYALLNQAGEVLTDFKYINFLVNEGNPIILAMILEESNHEIMYVGLASDGTQISPTSYSYLEFMPNLNFLKYALEPFPQYALPETFGILTTDFEVLTACVFKDCAFTMSDWDMVFVYLTDTSGKMGVFDYTRKKLVVPCQFQDISHFDKGFIVQGEGGIGVMENEHFEQIIPCTYIHLALLTANESVVEGLFIAQKPDFKMGIINTKNEIVVPFEYDQIQPNIHTETNEVTLEKYYFWNKKGECSPAIYALLLKQRNAVTFSEGYAKISELKADGEYFGFINEKFEIVIPCEYPDAYDFREGVAWVRKGELWGAIDAQNKLIIPFEYTIGDTYFQDGFISLYYNNECQIIDKQNTKLLSTEESINSLKYFGKGLCSYWIGNFEQPRSIIHDLPNNKRYDLPTFYPIAVGEGFMFYQDENDSEKYHCMDYEGKPVFEVSVPCSSVEPFQDGIAIAAHYGESTGYFLINTKGEKLTEAYLELAYCGQGLYKFRKADYYLGGEDATVLEYNAEGIQRFLRDDLYGVIDAQGNVVIELEYTRIEVWSDTHLFLRKVGEEGEYGLDYLYDLQTKTLQKIPDIADIQSQIGKDNLILTWQFKDDTKESWLYGYVDLAGKVVIPYIYTDASPFQNGVATVQKDGKYGLIDTQNQTVMPFEFDGFVEFNDYFAKGFKQFFHTL